MASFNLGRFLKNPLKGLENAGRSVGKIARQAAPVVGLIPGVGTALGATIGGLGSVLEGRKFSDSLKSAATGGLSGFANSKLLGGKGIKGVIPGLKAITKSGLSAVGGGTGLPGGNLPDGTEFGMEPVGGGGGGWLDKLGSVLGKGAGLVAGGGKNQSTLEKILGAVGKYGLPALGAYQSSKQQGEANELRKKALALSEASYAEGAPLRKLGMSGLTDPRLRDLSSTFATPKRSYTRLTA